MTPRRGPGASSGPPVHDQAAANDRFGVPGVDVLAAFRAHNADSDAVAARPVQQIDGRSGKTCPLVAPLHERDVDREQRTPFGGESILIEVACGVLSIASTLQNAVVDEPVQALGEDVAGQSDTALEVLEPPGAVERLSQDHPHPALPDDRGGAGDRAVLIK